MPPKGPNLTMLRSYSQKSDPTSLPPSILLKHTQNTITIFDAYPKSIFHFLVLPRIRPPLNVFHLSTLRTLLKRDKAHAKEVLRAVAEDAQDIKKMIEEEMVQRYGFKWEIWMGFHAVPSMEHLHLHVISTDLCSPSMKVKKHYNSFHPTLGFFLHLDDVMSWFDAEESYFAMMSKLSQGQYEPLLKEPLSCWRCGRDLKNMPALKAHLQEEWDRLVASKKKSSASGNEETLHVTGPNTNMTKDLNMDTNTDTDTTTLKRPREKRHLDDPERGHELTGDQHRAKKQETETKMT